MSYQTQPIEVNNFVAGLNTDSSPLTPVDNTSIDEINFVLNVDGSRQRRLGMDFEEDAVQITPSFDGSLIPTLTTQFLWENAGGTGLDFIVIANNSGYLKIFGTQTRPYSDNELYSVSTSSFSRQNMTTINGILFYTDGAEVVSIKYQNGSFTRETSRLLIRDLFGVDDILSGVDLLEGNNVSIRTTTLSDAHRYNLRNQGWGIPRPVIQPGTGPWTPPSTLLSDPVSLFADAEENNKYPSNADSVSFALFADPTDEDAPTLRKFSPEDLIANPIGNSTSAKGYFIIDWHQRGISRATEYSANQIKYPELQYPLSTSLPSDTNVVSQNTYIERFAGRLWYAGFSPNIQDKMERSPSSGSFILFSQLIKTEKDAVKCYQENDPTSPDMPDILDTDGGFINITGAENIMGLKEVFNGLIVFAENGVWVISGTSNNGFTATSFSVDKVTDRGCIARDSITVVGNAVFYWGKDGIYVITPNQYGELEAQRISEGRIQKLLEAIPNHIKSHVQGIYDGNERKIKWLYNLFHTHGNARELVLDTQLQAFYLHEIKGNDEYGITPIGYIPIPDNDKSIDYLISTQTGPFSYTYSFGNYGQRIDNNKFRDWHSVDGVGIDASACMVTSFLSGGDYQRRKDIPYITVHLRRTETGIITVGEVSTVLNPSSCIVRVMWDWANSSNSNKYGRPFQAYRYKKEYRPTVDNDDFDTGFLTIVSKNKLRGSGKVASIEFSTEPDKDCHIYGWSMVFGIAGIV